MATLLGGKHRSAFSEFVTSQTEDTRSIQVASRVRPLRLAFVVDTRDRETTLLAMRLCACRWGGLFNAIIPAFKTRPAWADGGPKRAPGGPDLVQGYITSFEPDYLVECRKEPSSTLDVPSRLVIPLSQVNTSDARRGVGFGVSALEVFRDAYEREFQFVRKHEAEVVLPKPRRAGVLPLLTCVLGAFPQTNDQLFFENGYIEAFAPEEIEVTEEKIIELAMQRHAGVPIRAGTRGLVPVSRAIPPSLFFVFSPGSTLDLIDFWNLRAFGLRPLPVPAGDLDAVAAIYAANSSWDDSPSATSPLVAHSPRLDEEVARNFGEAMKVAGYSGDFLTMQKGTPRLWEPAHLQASGVERIRIHAKESETEAPVRRGRIQFECPQPEIAGDSTLGRGPSWAAEIDLRGRFLESELAEVFPDTMRDVTSLLNTVGRFPVTTSKSGLVVRCSNIGRRQYWTMPSGQGLFRAWLGELGFKTRTSSAGQTTFEVLRAVGSPLRAGLFGHPELIRILDRAASGLVEEQASADSAQPMRGHVIPYDQLRQVLGQIHDGDNERAISHARALTNLDVIRPLVRLECPDCHQRNWYSPDDLSLTVSCERCLREFQFPSEQPPNRSSWGYRPVGPFSASGCAHGAYTVALCLRFLTEMGMGADRHTWTVGVESYDDGGFEIDFGLLLQSDYFGEEFPQVVFGEAKTFGMLERKDFDRGLQLLTDFPESFLVFATLRKSLEETERHGLDRLLRATGRRGYYPHRGRVIVLTETELCDDMMVGPDYRWKQLGGRFSEVAERFQSMDGLKQLSDATLLLYANHDWSDL